MSYILDALRRADAERERGAVPSIHAQTVPPASDDTPRPTAGKPLLWMVAALSLALVGSMAWQMASHDSAAPAGDAMHGPTTVAPATGTSPAPTQPPAVAQSLPPVPAPAIVAEPRPEPALPPVAPPARTQVQATKPQPAPAAASPGPATAAANERVPSQGELPENIRREIPKLVVGGSIYSPNPASRFLILNGQIFHENDKVAPDLVLEQIKLKAAVLRYKGHRFGITY